MHHPKHTYLTGIITGALMGIVMTFLSYTLMVFVAPELTVDRERLFLFLQIMIFSNVLIGAIFGTIVSLIVHGISKKS